MSTAAASTLELGPEAIRRQVTRLKSVPTLPRLLERVIAALDDPEIDFNNVAELIEVDQALTSQILRLANSAFYSSNGGVGRVPQALLMLGTVVTRSVALSTTMLDMQQVDLRGFWEHSIGCGVAAGALAKVTGRVQPEEATAAGLLHDLGKVVLFKELPEVFARVVAATAAERKPFGEVERELLGVDHCEIASWLVDKWRFPPCLAEPILYHHAPAKARVAKDATAIVHVADVLVRMLAYGSGGDDCVPPIDAGAWKRLALGPEALDRVLVLFDADLDHALNYALLE